MRPKAVEAVAVNIALAAATCTLLLGGPELAARWAEPAAAAAPADYITDGQAWQGEFYTVKSTAVSWPPWEDYNTDGLRDREHAIERRPGTRRIACLGDSVTLGWGIRPDQAWPQVLEEQAAASGVDLDVMNVALGGWSTRQELIADRRIVRRYRPDQVLLGLCLADVAEMQNNLSRPPRLLAQLHRRSALVRWIVGARRREIAAVEELFSALFHGLLLFGALNLPGWGIRRAVATDPKGILRPAALNGRPLKPCFINGLTPAAGLA